MAAAAVVGTVASSVISADASKDAAGKVAGADTAAANRLQDIYSQTTANLNPYIQQGTNALYSLSNLYGLGGGPNGQGGGASAAFQQFTQTPAYQFASQQGNLGANRALAASGLAGSPAAVKGISQYNQGLASGQFNQWISNLQGLSGLGESAGASLGGLGNQSGIAQGQATMAAGQAQGAGILGQAQAINSGIQGVEGALGAPTSAGGGAGSSLLGQGASYLGGLYSGMSGSSYAPVAQPGQSFPGGFVAG